MENYAFSDICVDRKTIHLEQAVLKMTGKMSGQI